MSRGKKIVGMINTEEPLPFIISEDRENDSKFLNQALQHDVIVLSNSVQDTVTDSYFLSIQNDNFLDDKLFENYDNIIENKASNIDAPTLYNHNNETDITTKDNYYTINTQLENKLRIVDYSDSESEKSEETFLAIPVLQKTTQLEKKIEEQEDESSVDDCSGDDVSESDFSNGGNNTNETESTSSETNTENNKGKKRKRKERECTKNQKRRHLGKSYLNYKKQKVEAKKLLPNPCFQNHCVNKCNTFTEEERRQIFSLFWSMKGNLERRSFINGCVNVIPVKRKRTLAQVSRRSLTYQYYFMKADVQARVCLKFFLNTLNITQKLVRNSIEGKIKENRDCRGKHKPKHKATTDQIEEFKSFIDSLPAVPSHYCRSSSKKLYLPADIKNIANLYRMYSTVVKDHGSIPLGSSSFRKIFKRDYNIGIHVPKKDKCVKCTRYENIPEEEKTESDKTNFLEHIKEKDDAKQLFLYEQTKSTENGFIVVSFDLQKVLTTPHGKSMMFGFSRKYAVYNFTIYESNSQNGYCYIWEEKDGKRGVNEICTHLYNYLLKVDNDENHINLSLFCDNCPGQNKNRFVLSMLLYFLKNSKSVTSISITYLVTGHTYMPVDSVHAVIEKYTSNMNIQAPSEWPTLIRNARRRPRPYDVICVRFDEFLDWKSMWVPKKIKTSDGCEIKMADIKWAKFEKSDLNCIQVSTSYSLDAPFHKIDWSVRKVQSPPQLYSSELPINKNKLTNLLHLCKNLTIKKQYHSEYFSLSSGKDVPDELPESDIEDNMAE